MAVQIHPYDLEGYAIDEESLEVQVGELTDDERQELLEDRGGCNCAVVMPPCSTCTTPLTEGELMRILEARNEACAPLFGKTAEKPQGWGDW